MQLAPLQHGVCRNAFCQDAALSTFEHFTAGP